MQIQTTINTDAEFRAALMADGEKVLAILDYIYRRDKENIFGNKSHPGKKLEKIHKIDNLCELIQEIKDANAPTAPQFN